MAYSRAFLSHPEDKLVALSGFTKVIASLLEDEYVAGLWHRSLPMALLWRVKELSPSADSCPYTRPSVYRGPSFSWVAIDAPVLLEPIVNGEPLIEILTCETEAVTSDRTGMVRGAFLRLRGTLYPALVVVSKNIEFHALPIVGWEDAIKQSVMNERNDQTQDSNGGWKRYMLKHWLSWKNPLVSFGDRTDWIAGVLDVSPDPDIFLAFLLPVEKSRGLVLLPAGCGNKQGVYTRCGMCYLPERAKMLERKLEMSATRRLLYSEDDESAITII